MGISSGYNKANADQNQILMKAINAIKSDTNVDIELLNILEKHAITLNPSENSVDQAMEKIKDLAKKRAED